MVNNTDIRTIHRATMAVLADPGVAFHSARAVRTFRHHGFETDGNRVFFTERQINEALQSAPSTFTILGRNRERNVTIGAVSGQAPVPALAPGYGAPFIIQADGERRKATLADYDDFCRLTQTSDVINFNGFLMGDPSDLDPASYHLEMLARSVTLCDKPFMGAPLSARAARDTVDLIRLVFGEDPGPVTASIISTLAPLQVAEEMADSLMILSAAGQPVIVTGGAILGSTGPIGAAGTAVISNAAALAGITLAQLVNLGTPVIYGAAGSPLDMRTGAYYIGGPESAGMIRTGAALARHYGLPCRGGGALNDSHSVDYQAGYQSALALDNSIRSGMDFILAACGILGTFMAMSFEKFMADEDMCRHSLKANSEPDLSAEAVDLKTIRQVGVGGQYLTHPTTFSRCRTEFARLALTNRLPFDKWREQGGADMAARAEREAADRLAAYTRPDIDPGLERNLDGFVARRRRSG